MPKTITIKQLEEGMVLHSSAINTFGQTLVPAGTIINQNHINALKTWNISSVIIKTEETEDKNEFSEELLELAKQDVYSRIKWEPSNKNELDLINLGIIAVAHRIKKQQKK